MRKESPGTGSTGEREVNLPVFLAVTRGLEEKRKSVPLLVP